jgi:hypothetical protein
VLLGDVPGAADQRRGAEARRIDAIDMNAIPMYMIQMVNGVKEDVAAGRRD